MGAPHARVQPGAVDVSQYVGKAATLTFVFTDEDGDALPVDAADVTASIPLASAPAVTVSQGDASHKIVIEVEAPEATDRSARWALSVNGDPWHAGTWGPTTLPNKDNSTTTVSSTVGSDGVTVNSTVTAGVTPSAIFAFFDDLTIQGSLTADLTLQGAL